MRRHSRTIARFVVSVAALVLASGAVFAHEITTSLPKPTGRWVLRAEGPVIIGGYGDNFAYDAENVRPLIGYAQVDLDAANHRGSLEAVVWTTPESGPILIGKDEPLEGKIRWVQEFEVGSPGDIATFVWLHGDSGYEAPVLPVVWNWLATWGPVKVYVNDELAYTFNAGHFMWSVRTRDDHEAVRKPDGTVFHPSKRDFHGYVFDPDRSVLHFVAHSDEPDRGNFPPFSRFLQINFETVYALGTPAGFQPGAR